LKNELNLSAITFLWAFSAPIAVLLIGVGSLIISKEKKSRIWLFSLLVFLIVFFTDFLLRGFLLQTKAHFPPLFGIGGGVIILLFLATAWYGFKKRNGIKLESRKAFDYQLMGLLFFFLAAWFLCGVLGSLESESSFAPKSPVNVMVYFLLGWFFTFLSQFKSSKTG